MGERWTPGCVFLPMLSKDYFLEEGMHLAANSSKHHSLGTGVTGPPKQFGMALVDVLAWYLVGPWVPSLSEVLALVHNSVTVINNASPSVVDMAGLEILPMEVFLLLRSH